MENGRLKRRAGEWKVEEERWRMEGRRREINGGEMETGWIKEKRRRME